MKSAIIGYSGFIGSNLVKLHKFTDYYNSQNIKSIKNKKYDLIVSAATKAERWRANQNPEKDWKEINNLLKNLKTVKTKHFVLISTVDVYPNPNGINEDFSIKKNDIKQAYGRNRFKMEQKIRAIFSKVTILRLPQIFGEGLKKNFAYDLIHDNALDFTHKDSLLQFYNLKNLWKDIQKAIKLNVPVLNLAIEPITAKELAKFSLGINFKTITPQPPFRYDMTTKFGKYLYSKKQILKELKEFILKEKSKTKIAISNLAWNKKEENIVIPLLKKYQITGIELAPSKIWKDPTKVKQDKIEEYKKVWKENGIQIIAVTSLLFRHPELTIFESKTKREKTLNYLKKMIKLTSDLGAKVIVFGSPKNRIVGKLDKKSINGIAVKFFKDVSKEARKYNITFCIEPVPEIYGSDYILNTSQARSLVKKINSENIKINMDSGAMKINKEDFKKEIKKSLNLIGHFHISEKGFNGVSDTKFGHGIIVKTLKNIKYKGWVSIEMWAKDSKNNIKSISNTLEFVKKIYE